jgi:NAD(P)-dependent dehydrogenase (short-subunit alcohol dehydrogenase family)
MSRFSLLLPLGSHANSMYENDAPIAILNKKHTPGIVLTIAECVGILFHTETMQYHMWRQVVMQESVRTALVTGGTGALGSIVVRTLAESGASLALPVRQLNSVEDLMRSYPSGKVYAAVADLEEDAAVNSFVAEAAKRLGTLDALVNLAGGYAGGNPIEGVTLQEWESMMNLNLRTVFLMCRAVLPIMRANSYGRIVNIAAMPALTSGANKGPYAISKRSVIGLTETIADETKGTGITANALAPSIILTESNKQSMPGADFSKWVTPEEIAELILYLCSSRARSVSGNVIKMFGGV